MDPVEQIAIALHDGWMEFKNQSGHAHNLSWDDLAAEKNIEAMNQDRFQASLILLDWWSRDVTLDDLPDVIQRAIFTWEKLNSSGKDYVVEHFADVEEEYKNERLIQAEKIMPILEALPQQPD